jgi:hypothetical protein
VIRNQYLLLLEGDKQAYLECDKTTVNAEVLMPPFCIDLLLQPATYRGARSPSTGVAS